MWPCPRRLPSPESARNLSGACMGLVRHPRAGKPSIRLRWRASASSEAGPMHAASTTRRGT
eukprot:9613352-Alexandrium_andersonii.AAC.1